MGQGRRFAGWVLAAWFAAGVAAQAKGRVVGDWAAVERLKPGTKVVVTEPFVAEAYPDQTPCQVIRIDHASLTCRPEGDRARRIVYPAERVLTVYQVKMRVTAGSWARLVLFPGFGFLMGCAVTDDRPDYPLGALAGAGGAALAAGHISRHPKFELIYRSTEALPAAAVR